jgi:hypothetical protein
MDHDTAARLRAFKNNCNCGGYARDGEHPHLSWCQQYEEYEEWYKAVTSDGSTKTPSARIAELESSNEALREIANELKDQSAKDCQRVADLEAQLARAMECSSQTRAALMSLREIVRHRADLQSMDKVTVDLAGSVLERHEWIDLERG